MPRPKTWACSASGVSPTVARVRQRWKAPSAFTCPGTRRLWPDAPNGIRWNDPDMQCMAKGMPAVMITPHPVTFIEDGSNIRMLAHEYGVERTIYIDNELPEERPPSTVGYSVGRWEGDTLVVETDRHHLELLLLRIRARGLGRGGGTHHPERGSVSTELLRRVHRSGIPSRSLRRSSASGSPWGRYAGALYVHTRRARPPETLSESVRERTLVRRTASSSPRPLSSLSVRGLETGARYSA